MLLGGGINKAVSLLIIACLFFALTASGSAGATTNEGGGYGTSLLCGMGSRLYMCLPKETVTEAGGAKPHIYTVLWVRNDIQLALQGVAALDVPLSPKAYHSSKIVEVTYKKDGKK